MGLAEHSRNFPGKISLHAAQYSQDEPWYQQNHLDIPIFGDAFLTWLMGPYPGCFTCQ